MLKQRRLPAAERLKNPDDSNFSDRASPAALLACFRGLFFQPAPMHLLISSGQPGALELEDAAAAAAAVAALLLMLLLLLQHMRRVDLIPMGWSPYLALGTFLN